MLTLVCVRYATSKLIQVFGVRELAIRATHGTTWQAPTVIINCLTPGACLSDFDRESTGFARFKWNVMAALLARTTEAGSRTLVNAVSAGEESHGSYLNDCRITEYVVSRPIVRMNNEYAHMMYRPGPLVVGSEGMALQKKVWDQLVTQLETIQPRISQNI